MGRTDNHLFDIKYKLFVLTILSSVGFFNYHYIFSDQLQKFLFYFNVLLCLAWVLKDGKTLRQVKYPRLAFVGLILSIIVSAVMATAFHSQGLLVSIMTTLPFIFAYGYFWILMKMDIPNQKIMNTYIVFAALSTVVYFCNVITAPANIFGEPLLKMDTMRGVLRMPVVFIEFFPLLVFYGINKLLLTKEKKWIVLIAWISFMIIMSVIRQIIALTAILGLWFFFRRISMWKKIGLVLVCLGILMFVLPNIPVYKALIELSENQRDNNDDQEDIRLVSWRYYTYENQTNALSPILGNGVPSYGNSPWGKLMESETMLYGTAAADVGWAGFFWYFGAIATICLLILIIKAYIKPKKEDQQYLNYWLIFITITSLASGPLIYYWQIIDIMVCLYLVFHQSENGEDTLANINSRNDETTRHNTKQLNRYPQLDYLHSIPCK